MPIVPQRNSRSETMANAVEASASTARPSPCDRTGSECMCYVNSVELTNGADAEVEDGDVIWCLRASPDMGHEIEILSVGSPSDASEGEGAALFYA